VKRVKDVVRVFARVDQQVPSVLVMVGDGPDRVDAETEARALGVQDKVFFLGKIDTVAPLLSGADLFLLPSSSESFGLSALEALACGVPVIGTRTGGLPEVIIDGETGVLCAVGDVDAMAEASVRILLDGDRWHAMSSRAAADARERFSLDEIVAEYEKFYEYTLARPSTVDRQASVDFRPFAT
jgi:N-acetyl-alpha-D-glucosaminyl L-malate synthase BshA